MGFQSIALLSKRLKNRELSCEELTYDCLQQIKNSNKTLNCFITICESSALNHAKLADKRLQTGNGMALTGIPFAHKDIFCTKGIKTSCGSKMLDNFIAPYDAAVSERLNEQGMILLGKTNMDEFAMGSSTENSFYGETKNPWDLERVPGGSSGGSAASVAADLVPVATATDTGGSIRQPAAFCGVTGLKPTYGRVSRHGMIAYASSLDQGGVVARYAEDVALLLSKIAGFDSRDATSVERPVDDYLAVLNTNLDGLRIGLPKFYFENIDTQVATVIQAAISELEKLGAKCVEIEMPHAALAIPSYYVIALAECSANLARFDGVRYGYRCSSAKSLSDLYCRSRGEAFGQEVKRRILLGTYVLSAGYYDAYYLKAQKIRRLICNDFSEVFKTVDVIVGPTTPTPAFRLGEKIDDAVMMYLSDIYTVSANLAGLPAISIPAGFVSGLPVGLQMISSHFNEAKLLNIAHRFQQITDWHERRPKNGLW